MSSSPSKPVSRAGLLPDPATIPIPASPQTNRTVRRFNSHQQLASNPPSLIAQQRTQQQRSGLAPRSSRDDLQNVSRLRAKSDAPPPQEKRPSSSRKMQAMSAHARKSSLEHLLREGPLNGDLTAGLNELRYKVLSSRVEATNTGMSEYRIYLWLILLNVPTLPTDEYLSLVHRGKSPADPKIRNDTFRTLATDPLFQRRVTEASITRVLNAIAWKLHDTKQELHVAPDPTADSDPFAASTSSSITPESSLYVQGMNVLSAPFLYASRSESEAFALFHHFLTTECPGYVRGAMEGVHRGLALVDKCLALVEPKLSQFLLSKGMHAEIYAFPSVLTLCACTPPLPEVLHLWDFLFAYGPHLNILCIVAQLLMLKDQLLASPSPGKILQKLPQLDSEKIIGLAILALRKIPDALYEELVNHAK